MAGELRYPHHWIVCVAALAVWLALGWPSLRAFNSEAAAPGSAMLTLWLVLFGLFGTAVLGAIVLKLRTNLRWTLLHVQLVSVMAMVIIQPRESATELLMIMAWQVAMLTSPGRALGWVAFQTLAIVTALALAPRPELSYITGLSVALQLCCVLTAHALRKEAEAARALDRANRELQSAQAMIAHNVRDEERLRISRELHDAWGHELTALGLQLEIASHVTEPGRANGHVRHAKGLAGALLAKVRGVVATLRETEQRNSNEALEALARGGPAMPADASADPASQSADSSFMAGRFKSRHSWIFGVAALSVWLAIGWPIARAILMGMTRLSPLWLVAFGLFGAAVLAAIVLASRPRLRWALQGVQLAAVVAMTVFLPWAMMSVFLTITAWQVAMTTTPRRALAWVAFQSLTVVGALALAPRPDLCWVVGLSVGLQLFFVFTAQALRMQAETARALAQTNRELRAAQAIIANNARDAERLRISRELHDAWGHELTALGLQLEIASNVSEPGRANGHVLQAKSLARDLLAKVRDVVATLRETERCDLKEALEALAKCIPTPAIHVDISPRVQVGPDQAHALIRCAQEAVTNAVKHAEASNLWLQVTTDGEGVRLVARNDGSARPAAPALGSGLVGMRERLEHLGGKLAVRTGAGLGFTVDAWLPARSPQIA